MTKRKGKSLDEFASERDQAQFAENQEIARVNRTLRAAVREKDVELKSLGVRLHLIEQLEAAAAEPPKWLAPKRPPGGHVGIPSLMLTDVHWDEVVYPDQVDMVNKYNRQIAILRLKRAFSKTITVTRDYWAGVKYEGFQLFLGGDLISGIIHEELRETNEAAVMESVITVLEPLEAGINLLVEQYGKVNITAVVGNHGRNTKKPRAKNRARDNFDWLVYKLIERDYVDNPHVTIQVSNAADAHTQIYNTRYLLTHGDQFRGGTGISAALAPLLLGTYRKSRRQAVAGRPYDIMVMGHWHQTIWLPSKGLIVGGSVVGYNEYAYQQNLEPEPPQQSLWLTTPERGITLTAPVFVSKREEEGW